MSQIDHRIRLNDGHSIPQLGLGFWQLTPTEAEAVATEGLAAGYRLLDTAEGYSNEEGVGAALARSNLQRSDIYVTTKLRNAAHSRDAVLREFDASMEKLGVEVLDLFLIHWPRPAQDLYVEAWKTLIELRDQGRIASIGVSNFNEDHLQRLIDETGVTPAVNQIELHPGFQQQNLRQVHQRLGIVTESWSPLGQGGLLDNPAIGAIANRLGRTPAQVIIRWHLQQGLVVIPKSANAGRIRQNADVFAFSLSDEDLAAISALDRADGRVGPDPRTAEFSF